MTNQANDHEFSQRIFQQFMDIFVLPEIELRQEKGEIEKPLSLNAAQIIFFPDGRRPQVRLNREVKAIGEVKLRKGLRPKPGQPITENDVIGLEKIKLVEGEDPDCGHATLIKINDTWNITFDFRYNKKISRIHSKAAFEFYEAAENAYKNKHWSAFIDNLFSCCELSAKSILLLIPDKKFKEKTTHSAVHSKFNRFSFLGNVEEHHIEAYNKLYSLRKTARYLRGEFDLTEEEADFLLKSAKDMADYSLNYSKT